MKRWLILLLLFTVLVGSTFAQIEDVELPNTETWGEFEIDYPDGWRLVPGEEDSLSIMGTNTFGFVLVVETNTSGSLEEHVEDLFNVMSSTSLSTDVETITINGEEIAYYHEPGQTFEAMGARVLDEGRIVYILLLPLGIEPVDLDEGLAMLASVRVSGDDGEGSDNPLSGLLGNDDEEEEEEEEEDENPLGFLGGSDEDEDAVDPSTLDLSGTPEEICEAATPAIEPETREYSKAQAVLEEDVDYLAIFCTDAGAILVDLFEEETPVTVNNFIFLAQNNYYNNTIFHRVIEEFMAQGGDPTGTGRGGPGYQFQDEIVDDLVFDRPGLLAMANAGADTNGSQFFITFAETPWLDGAHTIFGEVVEGMDVLDDILLRDPQVSTAEATTLETVVIITDPDQLQ